LVVEDDVAVARALSRTLARRGFSVASARSCAAARALRQRFEVAILDLDLPDGNGVSLARELIERDRIATILFFTGSTDQALLARARRLGTVIMKSAGTSELFALLSQEGASGEPPESQTAPSPKARSLRASSGTQATSASASRKSRAR
jgi:DNA-binding response OmpR family regulator